jgi:outer membrane biosynthesis protein TonB
MNGNQQQQPQRKTPAGKPGAMTMAMQAVQVAPPTGPKVLRIGLIQDGKIVEERIIRKRETVSVGTSERNHFILGTKELPSRFELFQLIGNDYILNFTDKMKGRVALAGGVQDLETLRTTGGARNAGTHWQVKLNDGSRGKVVVGNVTLLFQFVVPPPIQPRPQLPAAARGGFVKSIDWMFTTFVVFSYMIFFAFIVYLESADWPIDQGIAAVPSDLAEFIFQEPPAPPEDVTPVEDATEMVEEGTEEEVAQAPSSGRASSGQNSGEAPSAEAVARIREEARASAEAMLLGALGDSGEGALADVLAGGAATAGAADVLAQAQGVGVATSRGGGSLRTRGGGGGSGQAGGLGSLRAAGGAGATQARQEGTQIVERRIRGRVSFQSGDEIGGSGMFDQSQVVRMIRQRQSAFKRCYETSLRNNPSLQGKVTVQFTIEQRGNVSAARAVENTTNDAGLASCVVGVIRRLRWREGPEGGSVQYSYPFVFAPQN